MTIPASQIVQVNPGVLAAAGSAIDLNGLILTTSPYPPIGSVPSFASAADVGAYFGLSSLEYEAALIYFAGPSNASKTPGLLYFAQYPTAAVGAYTRGAPLNIALSALQALTGTLTVTANGTPISSSSINLSAATSFSNAATIITAAFTSPPFAVTWDAQHNAFVFTNTTTGSTSTIGYVSGTLAAGLNLAQSSGAVISAGAAIATPGTALPAITAVTMNWAAFTTTFEPVTADKIAFSAWAASANQRFVYVGFDSDPNAKVSGNQTTWGYAIAQAKDDGTIPVYGDLTHAAFVLSAIASTDFSRTNGRATLAFQQQSGLLPSVTSASDAQALIANGYNYYGAYATANQSFTFLYPGSISGKWLWADSFINQIWLNAQLQLAMFTLLQSAGSIPYNPAGYAMVNAAILDPVNAAVNFGAIRTGVALSASQVAQIKNAVGADVSGAITANGYYLKILPASASIRATRSSPSMTLYYADGGSIQSLTLSSIEIV